MSSFTVNLGTVFKGSSSGKVVAAKGADRTVQPRDVVIDITHSGLCYTDIHYLKKDMVLGHEGVGIVSQVGPQVKSLKKGDRVGWGYNHDSCGTCKFCKKGRDTNCYGNKMYGNADLDQASFGDKFVITEDFCHIIPQDLELKHAAPLQCGGATVFGAMHDAGISPYDRVGVIGIGGLGHLAIQFLNKMGCEVVVFSGSENKKEEAIKLGAHEFVAAKVNPSFQGVKPLDYLLVTTSAQPDWKTYLKVLEKDATIIPLSVDEGDFTFPYMPIIGKQLKIQGSLVATREVHQKMLQFAARHGIKPIIEEVPMTEEGINQAVERLKKGDVRYRFVAVSQTNKVNSANL
ncbi:probable NADP-dependent alcohol dehydrogenase [Melanopsichium pennsylvanicum]|uniref:Probable NADP-dependent alcohol dehydrogenase n=2 Tax=Melanopsichium pennsylvanicum TaxID=63383 RepID=A0AAJ4XPA0_9BASI|nr:probable NADP-dependent alcohol dehydrogenase [Melanopsichium pennsylvanicum 4]SNX85392.1 probable NADP-dependent alcohol dehydrogenase [Melanopsichium pennsylvanicum]